MKFTWGTGILAFLILFLLAMGALVLFTARQGINLVHKDYYEKGVDHMEQIEIDQRSASFENYIHTSADDTYFLIRLDEELSSQIDSGGILLFRPSDSNYDRAMDWIPGQNELSVARSELIRGRYILKIYWYSKTLRYEIDLPVDVPKR